MKGININIQNILEMENSVDKLGKNKNKRNNKTFRKRIKIQETFHNGKIYFL